jgi:hypothetical protein
MSKNHRQRPARPPPMSNIAVMAQRSAPPMSSLAARTNNGLNMGLSYSAGIVNTQQYDRSVSSGSTDEDVTPNVPGRSYAYADNKERTNLGNTAVVMALLSEMWILNLIVLLGGVYLWNFQLPLAYTGYTDSVIWNVSCYWKLGK